MATVRPSEKKQLDITIRLTNAMFKETLKYKESRKYIELRNDVEHAVSYTLEYVTINLGIFADNCCLCFLVLQFVNGNIA